VVAFFGWGLGFYGVSVYLVVLHQRHGWPISSISLAITAYYVLGASLVVLIGDAFDRFGPRKVVLAAMTALGIGVLLLTAVSRPWHLYAAYAVMAVGWAGMSGAAINAVIAPWFERKRGRAVSLALNGASFGGVVMTWSSSVPTLYIASVAFGLGVGNVVTFPALIVQTEYPREHFNRIVSLIVAINQFTFAFGPGALGWARDWWGSYSAALVLCAACEIVALVVVSSTSSLLGRYLSRPSRPDPCR